MSSMHDNPWAMPSGQEPKRLGGPSPKLSRRVSEKFERGMEKSKVLASASMKKVKEGASTSVNWLKVKYNKHKLAQRK